MNGMTDQMTEDRFYTLIIGSLMVICLIAVGLFASYLIMV